MRSPLFSHLSPRRKKSLINNARHNFWPLFSSLLSENSFWKATQYERPFSLFRKKEGGEILSSTTRASFFYRVAKYWYRKRGNLNKASLSMQFVYPKVFLSHFLGGKRGFSRIFGRRKKKRGGGKIDFCLAWKRVTFLAYRFQNLPDSESERDIICCLLPEYRKKESFV